MLFSERLVIFAFCWLMFLGGYKTIEIVVWLISNVSISFGGEK